jgi:hypothetical protein
MAFSWWTCPNMGHCVAKFFDILKEEGRNHIRLNSVPKVGFSVFPFTFVNVFFV